MRLHHIIATPRGRSSNTLRISEAYVEALARTEPDLEVHTVDLFDTDLPRLAGGNVESKYFLMRGGAPEEAHADWAEIERIVAEFLEADAYLVSTPMWNFSVPYTLKHYIDVIVQPGYTFGRDEHGIPIGLVSERPMVCVTTRGADYSSGTPISPLDVQEVYLRAIFGFIGITDLTFVHAQPMDEAEELRDAAVAAAIEEARAVALGNASHATG